MDDPMVFVITVIVCILSWGFFTGQLTGHPFDDTHCPTGPGLPRKEQARWDAIMAELKALRRHEVANRLYRQCMFGRHAPTDEELAEADAQGDRRSSATWATGKVAWPTAGASMTS